MVLRRFMALWHEYNPGSASVDLLSRPPAYAMRTGTGHYFITPGQAYLHDRISSHAQTHRYPSLRDPAGGAAIRSLVLRPLGGSPGGTLGRFPRALFPFSFLRRCLRRAAFFAAKESGERNRQRGPISRRSLLGSLPDDEGGTGERGRGLRIATTSDIGHWFRNDTILLFGA